MSEKRKRDVIDLSQKLDIIKRLRRGESAVSIAPICDVGRTAVNDIEKNVDKIESHISKLQCCLWTIPPLIPIFNYKATMEK